MTPVSVRPGYDSSGDLRTRLPLGRLATTATHTVTFPIIQKSARFHREGDARWAQGRALRLEQRCVRLSDVNQFTNDFFYGYRSAVPVVVV